MPEVLNSSVRLLAYLECNGLPVRVPEHQDLGDLGCEIVGISLGWRIVNPPEDSTCEGEDDEEAETEAPDVSAGHHDDIDGLAFSSGGIFLAFGLK